MMQKYDKIVTELVEFPLDENKYKIFQRILVKGVFESK